MTKQEIEVGAVYRVRWHNGRLTDVRITGMHGYPVRSNNYPYGVTGSKTRYSAVNLATGRPVVIKSAAKLRERVS
jgi:hypothetical protein